MVFGCFVSWVRDLVGMIIVFVSRYTCLLALFVCMCIVRLVVSYL